MKPVNPSKQELHTGIYVFIIIVHNREMLRRSVATDVARRLYVKSHDITIPTTWDLRTYSYYSKLNSAWSRYIGNYNILYIKSRNSIYE